MHTLTNVLGSIENPKSAPQTGTATSSKLTTSEIASLMKHHAGNGLIYADSAEPRLIDELVTHDVSLKMQFRKW